MAKVIFITGQSNAQGRANSLSATPQELEYHQNALIWNNNEFQPLKISSYFNNQSNPNLHGVELPLAMKFKEEFPNETIYIVKHALGGSNIDANYIGGGVYENFKTNFFEPAINNLLSNGIEPEVYIYYSQGEAEANASRYQDFNYKLSLLINNYRNILKSDVHFIFPLIIENGILTHDTEVNNVFKNYEKNDAKISVIDSVNFPSDDALHWNYDGVNQLGNLVFEEIKRNKGGVVKYNLPYNFIGDNEDVISQNKKFIGNVDFKNAEIKNFPFQNKGFVYVDTNLSNSSESKLNNRFLPFHNLESAFNALPIDDNSNWCVYFINSTTATGCEIPFRNLEFFSEKPITIDFSNVNKEGVIINTINSLANANNIITHNYTSGNILIKSDYTGIQRFTNGSSFLKIEGCLSLNLKPNGGSNANYYNFQVKVPTNLRIKEWYCYSTQGSYILGFADGSNITFDKIINVDLNNKYTFRLTNFNTLHNANIEVKELNFIGGEFRSLLPVKISKITGTGVVNIKDITFNNCVCDNGITFNIVNLEKLEGVVSSNNFITGNVSSVLKIRNFEGKINALTVTGSLEFSGVNEVNTVNLITSNKPVLIKNGITVINGVLNATVTDKGILKVNN